MKIIIILLLLTTSLTNMVVFGQDYLLEDKSEIINHFREFTNNTYKISFVDTVNNLKVLVNGDQKIELEYFFNTSDAFCDSIIMKYSCSECIDKNIKAFLSTKNRKWKKLDNDVYISRKRMSTFKNSSGITIGSPKMVVKRTLDQPICATIYFSIPMLDKNKWKELTRK